MKKAIYLLVFSFLFLYPSQILLDYSIVKIEQPSSVYYDLWIANLSLVDLFLFLGIVINNDFKVSRQVGITILCVIAVSIFGCILQFLNGYSFSTYIDGIVFSIRVILYLLFFNIIVRKVNIFSFGISIYYLVFVLSVVSIFAFIFGGVESAIDGRFNLLAIGVNGSASLILYSILLFKFSGGKFTWPNVFCLFVLVLMLFLTGGRRSIAIFAIFAFVYFLSFKLTCRVLFFRLVFLTSIGSIMGYLFISGKFDLLLTDKVMYFFKMLDLSQLKEDGRYGMYQGVFQLIGTYPFGFGLSDWGIQSELQKFTTGSHTHSIIFQFYMKFGMSIVLMVVPLYFILVACVKTPFLSMLWFVFFINQLTGYGFWNQKYIAIICFVYIFTLYFGRQKLILSETK